MVRSMCECACKISHIGSSFARTNAHTICALTALLAYMFSGNTKIKLNYIIALSVYRMHWRSLRRTMKATIDLCFLSQFMVICLTIWTDRTNDMLHSKVTVFYLASFQTWPSIGHRQCFQKAHSNYVIAHYYWLTYVRYRSI